MSGYEISRPAIFAVGYAIITFSLIPLIRSDHWFVRIFDYPRSQKFWVTTAILLAFLLVADWSGIHDKIFLLLLFLNSGYLLRQIWNYTPLASIQMKPSATKSGESH